MWQSHQQFKLQLLLQGANAFFLTCLYLHIKLCTISQIEARK
jgi:hypothetical protein